MKILRIEDDLHAMIKSLAQEDGRTLAGYVDRHFRDQFQGLTARELKYQENTPPEKITAVVPSGTAKTFDLDEIISGNKKSEANATQASASTATTVDDELPCCKLPQPCKHWSWDASTGEGYVNSLSGRIREA